MPIRTSTSETEIHGSVEREIHQLVRDEGPIDYEELLEELGDEIGRETLNRVLLDGMDAGRLRRVGRFRYEVADH